MRVSLAVLARKSAKCKLVQYAIVVPSVQYCSASPVDKKKDTAFDRAVLLRRHYDELAAAGKTFYEQQFIYEGLGKILAEKDDLEALRGDPDLGDEASRDLEGLAVEAEKLFSKASRLVLPSRQFDASDAIMEVNAGVGGLEAGIFAGEIADFYTRYVASLGFETTILERQSAQTVGKTESLSMAKFLVRGTDVFLNLKYECGVHRVQRVPITGTKNDRLQTSTCSVAVYPQPRDDDVVLDAKDLKIDYMRSSGAGGQNVNKSDSACRVTYLPTGLAIKCQEERFREQNLKKAMEAVRAHLYRERFDSEMAALATFRKSQTGNMDRNEKIRSYNWQRNTISDHRLATAKQVPDIASFLKGAYGFQLMDEMRLRLQHIDNVEGLDDFLRSTHH